MKATHYILSFVFLWMSFFVNAQVKDSLNIKADKKFTLTIPKKYNPLSPAKAAFYSAIFPGAGQIYNNRYWWQLPLIYGGLGASFYYYNHNRKEFNRYRTAFKLRKAGLKDEFTNANGEELISIGGLESAQRQLRENRDISLLMGVLTYVLQIVEASVRAHLLQFDTDKNLSISPTIIPEPTYYETSKMGVTLKYSF